jgi:hypothetical protein
VIVYKCQQKYENNLQSWKQFTIMKTIYKFENNLQVWKQFTSMKTIYKYENNLQVWKQFMYKYEKFTSLSDSYKFE